MTEQGDGATPRERPARRSLFALLGLSPRLGSPAKGDIPAWLVRSARRAGARLWPLIRELARAEVEPRSSRRRRLLGIDVVVAFDLTLTAIVFGTAYAQLSSAIDMSANPFNGSDVAVVAAMLAFPAALRERWPTFAWATSLMGGLWASSTVDPFQAGGVIVFLYTLYTLAVRATNRRAVGTAWAISAIVAGIAYPPGLTVSTILITIPVVVGVSVYSKRTAQRRLADQERRHREERAVLEERQRIARELHDVVAHHMSVIAIQAEAAPYRVADPPLELTESFAGIRASALDGLTELRRVLGVLRAEDAEGEIAPQPDLDRLDELVATARAAGHTVATETAGAPRALPPATSLSAYRILQEALSNVLRHAPGAPISLRVDYGDTGETALRISVRNGPSATPPAPSPERGTGHGLVGMRERVALLGGELTAVPTFDGGYAVDVSLPMAKVIPGESEDG